MKKMIGLFLIVTVIISDLLLVFVWHPWQMKKDLDLIDVPVASKRLQHRQKIEESDISWERIPSWMISEDVLLSESEIVGKRISNEIVILKGGLFDRLALEEETAVIDRSSLNLNKGQAAFSIAADAYQAAGNTLVINQKVDLYVSLTQTNSQKNI